MWRLQYDVEMEIHLKSHFKTDLKQLKNTFILILFARAFDVVRSSCMCHLKASRSLVSLIMSPASMCVRVECVLTPARERAAYLHDKTRGASY